MVIDGSRPVRCPFYGAFRFRYDDLLSGFCDGTVSYAQPCVGHSRYQLSFNHCVDSAVFNRHSMSTRKQSEPAHLRQGNVVRQVAAPSSVLQRFPLCHIESNGSENFKMIQNPGFLSDHPQNWTTGSFCHSRHTLKISVRSVRNFLSYLANTQTDKQTDKQSLAKT